MSDSVDFENFDKVMSGLLAVNCSSSFTIDVARPRGATTTCGASVLAGAYFLKSDYNSKKVTTAKILKPKDLSKCSQRSHFFIGYIGMGHSLPEASASWTRFSTVDRTTASQESL
jgi:hypothetical protein